MKTLTITLHDTDNCGSSLQAFALQHFLEQNGIENEILNYVPNYVKNNGNMLKTILKRIIYFREYNNREKKFKEFSKKYLKVTNTKFKKYQELEKFKFEYDAFITGSDQLWNSRYKCGQDAAFYLKFVKNGEKKIAYAVSLGREKIPDSNIEILKSYARDFYWVSVREKSSVNQIKNFFPNTNVEYVCDPVLLNDSIEYNSIKSKRLINEKYILIYMAQIPDTDFMNKIITMIKEKIDGKILLIGAYRNRCISDLQIRDVAPGDFLSLIYNAEYIVSNSFHATMFSLIYEKQFLSVLPTENGARIKEILKYANIEKNGITTDTIINDIPYIDDYEKVTSLLNDFKNNSRKKLLKNLKGTNHE